MVVPVSSPHEDSINAVDAKASPIPYSKKDLIHWFNRVPIGMHSVAGDGLILWANSTLLSLLGYERDEYVGQSLLKVRHSSFPSVHLRHCFFFSSSSLIICLF